MENLAQCSYYALPISISSRDVDLGSMKPYGMLWYIPFSTTPYHITRLLSCTLNRCRPYRYMAPYQQKSRTEQDIELEFSPNNPWTISRSIVLFLTIPSHYSPSYGP